MTKAGWWLVGALAAVQAPYWVVVVQRALGVE